MVSLDKGSHFGGADLRSNEFVNVFMTQDTREATHIVTELLMQRLFTYACVSRDSGPAGKLVALGRRSYITGRRLCNEKRHTGGGTVR